VELSSTTMVRLLSSASASLKSLTRDVSSGKIGQHNDSRMNMALILTAVQYGAVAANHTEVVDLLKDSEGRISGCKMRDVITGREWETKSKVSFSLRMSSTTDH